MRSVKLLVAMAIMTAFVAGPVLAQDAMSGSTTAPTGTSKPVGKHHGGKKHAHHKKSSSTTAPADTSMTPAK